MAMISRFFKWVKQVWKKVTRWVFFWKHKAKPTILECSGSKEQESKEVEKTFTGHETVKLVEPPKEAELPGLTECPGAPEPYVLASTTESTEVGCRGRSLLRLPRMAIQSVSTLMFSALQSGWRMCRWKSSRSSTSVASPMRIQSSLATQEAEMLREVYLVLWAIRKHLRQLARRQERRRRRHIRTHASRHADSAKGLPQDARSPL